VDVTKLGIDKGYGMRKLRDILEIGLHEMLSVGDALFPGGNDYPAKEAGVESIQVRDPNESKRVIEAIRVPRRVMARNNEPESAATRRMPDS
jgi:hydroxymethylpyrimidine pyrophosphatase-like HAD family hydrolase